MKKKILLFGSQGMLGMQFLYDYENQFEIIPLSRFHLDLEQTESIVPEILKWQPHAVVNTAAWTAVDKAESPKFQDWVRKVNVDAVREIAKACEKLQIPFIHVSTDFVFGGKKKTDTFAEDDEKCPVNFYGLTKSQGEDAALKECSRTYILRTAWLYGEYGPNFITRILQQGKNKPEVEVVNDQFGNPTWTKYVGRVIADFVGNGLKPFSTPGIYHAVSEVGKNPPSWYDLALKAFELQKVKISLSSLSSDTLEMPTKRPISSVLKNTKLPSFPSWEEMLEEYLK